MNSQQKGRTGVGGNLKQVCLKLYFAGAFTEPRKESEHLHYIESLT